MADSSVRLAGAVNVAASVSAANVALTASGGNLTLGSGVTVTGAGGVTLATSAHFVNNAGASALSSGSGRWLVYSSSPVSDTTSGLTPDFYQYTAGIGATPAADGDGLLYALAPTLGVSLSGRGDEQVKAIGVGELVWFWARFGGPDLGISEHRSFSESTTFFDRAYHAKCQSIRRIGTDGYGQPRPNRSAKHL